MKFSKIFAIGLAAITMTACSDDDNKMNTEQDAVVSLGLTQMEVDEDDNGSIYNIPVNITGERNGNVKVTLEVTEEDAIEDVHFYVTTKTLTIGEDDNYINFEFHPTGDDVVNEDRKFSVSIVNAEGASIGNDKTCQITLLDDDKYMLEIYPKLLGSYTFSATASNGADVRQTWTMAGVEEGEPGFPHVAYITGLQGSAEAGFEAYLGYSPKAQRAWMRYELGQVILANAGFEGLGVMDVMLYGYDGSLVTTGTVTVNYTEDFKKIDFGANRFIGGLNLAGSDTWTRHLWFFWGGMLMTKN